MLGEQSLARKVATLLLMSDVPLTEAVMLEELAKRGETVSKLELNQILLTMQQASKADLQVLTVGAQGWQFRLAEAESAWWRKAEKAGKRRFSNGFWELLAAIAYRQPITRAEIEELRGVEVNREHLKKLFDLDWVRVSGVKEVPGHPELLVTTKRFLQDFQLSDLASLPGLTRETLLSLPENRD